MRYPLALVEKWEQSTLMNGIKRLVWNSQPVTRCNTLRRAKDRMVKRYNNDDEEDTHLIRLLYNNNNNNSSFQKIRN